MRTVIRSIVTTVDRYARWVYERVQAPAVLDWLVTPCL